MAPSTSERHLENGKPKSIDLLTWDKTEVGAAWFREKDSESVSRVALGPGRVHREPEAGTRNREALAGDFKLLDQAAPAGVGVGVSLRVRSLADQASRYYSAEV
jgi:hypothetical protein